MKNKVENIPSDVNVNANAMYQKHLERIIASLIRKYDLLKHRSEEESRRKDWLQSLLTKEVLPIARSSL